MVYSFIIGDFLIVCFIYFHSLAFLSLFFFFAHFAKSLKIMSLSGRDMALALKKNYLGVGKLLDKL